MKRIYAGFGGRTVILALIISSYFCLRAQGQSDYSVVSRGPDWKVWQKTVIQNGVTNVHSYTELATGLCYTNASGDLVDACETISLLPGGGAVANQARHTVMFPGDIGAGVLQITTPDGRQLQCRPAAICYDDGSNAVCLATITNAIGYLTASNQVTYRQAFSGLDADLVCTFRKSGFESDLVLHSQPVTPNQLGLNPNASTMELATEFFNTDDPQQIPAASDDSFDLQDYTLKFGQLTMTHGKAFAFRSTNTASQTGTPVYKTWQHIGTRTFLIEAVPLINIADNLNALPLQSSIEKPESKARKWTANSKLRTKNSKLADVLPPSNAITACTNRIELALNETRPPGVVLDYNTVIDGSDTYTFSGGNTYYISGVVNLTGTTTIDAGAILKYDPGAELWCDSVVCATTVDQPAILTSANDDSVGDLIAGSTGTPVIDQSVETGSWLNPGAYLCFGDEFASYDLQHLRVKYAHCVVADMSDKGGSADEADDCQFINCGTVFFTLCDSWTLNNDLFSSCEAVFAEGNGLNATAVDVTADHCWTFINDNSLNNGTITFTNSLITDVTTMMAVTNWSGWVPYTWPAFINLDHTVMANTTNGFTVYTSVASSQIPSAAGIYASAAAASNYLAASSPYHHAGTTNIDPAVLAELQTMTTYTPQDGGWPDTNGTALGYHYSVNDDSDFDGIPDWWIWQYFGNYNFNGTNLDSNGNTLLSDYQSYLNGIPVDPNIITFSVWVANNYVNTSTPELGLNIAAGSPGYYAVSIDDTNYATDAVWQAYTGTNLTASLGSVEGWHQLWIGLKGPATNATVTWQWKRLKLDLTPPSLTVTGPTNYLVTQPEIQLTGYSSEELSTLSYDITNAEGLFTGQPVFVTSQITDTNTWELTTNYFQAFDIPLTNGINTISLHAIDMAGNATTTNLTITLDYSSATNPPLVQINWPQNGTQISGTNFTLDGQLDNPTALVSAFIVDTNGDTNTISGMVGRDGKFWVEAIPLNTGTNNLTLTVSDPAGNVTVTNMSVVQASIVLQMDCVTPDSQLWQSTVNVTGEISDPDYAVWVNGVKGYNNGDGTWYANNVPTTDGGTASFTIIGYAPDEQQPDGSYGN